MEVLTVIVSACLIVSIIIASCAYKADKQDFLAVGAAGVIMSLACLYRIAEVM